MADIDELLKMLQSDNSRVRYDACEELREMPTLPPEAIDALYPLTIDEDQDVSDAAQRALAIHASTSSDDISTAKVEVGPEAYFIVLGSAVLTAIGLVLITRGSGDGFRYVFHEEFMIRYFLGAVPSFIFGTAGYFVWLRSWRKRNTEWQLKSVVGDLITTGFFAGLLPGICATALSD